MYLHGSSPGHGGHLLLPCSFCTALASTITCAAYASIMACSSAAVGGVRTPASTAPASGSLGGVPVRRSAMVHRRRRAVWAVAGQRRCPSSRPWSVPLLNGGGHHPASPTALACRAAGVQAGWIARRQSPRPALTRVDASASHSSNLNGVLTAPRSSMLNRFSMEKFLVSTDVLGFLGERPCR